MRGTARRRSVLIGSQPPRAPRRVGTVLSDTAEGARKRRVKPYRPSRHLLSLGELARLAGPRTKAQPEHHLARRWGLEADDLDARVITTRLDRVWRSWPLDEREKLLVTAECLAFAERQKRLWNPKENAERYRRLSQSAITAARLADELAAIFPPPWDGERVSVGSLIDELSRFVTGILYSTTFPAVRGATLEAQARMTRARSRPAETRAGLPPGN